MRWVSGNKGKRIWGNKIGAFGVFPDFFLKQKALPKTLIPLVGVDRIMGNKRFAGAWKGGKRYYGLSARRRREHFEDFEPLKRCFKGKNDPRRQGWEGKY